MTSFQPRPPRAGRSLRCEGAGALNRGCFNWVELGKLTEIQFRETFGAVICAACYIHDWMPRPQVTRALPITPASFAPPFVPRARPSDLMRRNFP